LLIDRHSHEMTMVSDVLRAEKRFNFVRVLRESDEPATPGERELLDFENQAYDVIIIGNISRRQLEAIDSKLPEKIRDLVLKRGVGLLFGAGDASYGGTADPNRPLDNGWRGSALENLLPVSLNTPPNVPPATYTAQDKKFQCIPTTEGLKFLFKVNGEQSREAWDRLNQQLPGTPLLSRMNGLSKLGEPKSGSTIFAVASDAQNNIPAGVLPGQAPAPYLMVGWQTGDGNRGRVLAWGGMNTRLWRSFGRRATPPTRDGFEIHAQFWRRVVLYLAHQEEDEGAAYARPEYRRIPTTTKQSIRIGLRTATGVEATEPKFDVRIVAPGQKPEEGQTATAIADAKGGNKVEFDPKLPGEYTVVLKAEGKDATGKELKGDATARFIAYAEASDEMLRAAADHDFLEKLAKTGGGKAYRLDDLPGFLKELKGQPVVTVKPKPRFLPDWRRNHSHGFLTSWMIAFALVLAAEWGLRRMWGLV
jgi:hypothetical protein